MGYCISQRDACFSISAENVPKALDAVKALATRTDKMSGGSYRDGQKTDNWFSWVVTSEFADAKSLDDALRAWRWDIEMDANGGVESIMFDGEKYGDEDILLQAMAPYVTAGSYIEMQGEDGAIWRWTFNGEKCVEQEGRLFWGEV